VLRAIATAKTGWDPVFAARKCWQKGREDYEEGFFQRFAAAF
jgi:hypothetical protein